MGKRLRLATNALIVLVITGLAGVRADQPAASTPASSINRDSQLVEKIAGSTDTTGSPTGPKARYVIVDPGRSLNGIAYENHVSPAALATTNHLAPPYKLKAGSRLLLPTTDSEADALNAQERSTLQTGVQASAFKKSPPGARLVPQGGDRSPPASIRKEITEDPQTAPICDIVCDKWFH